MSEYVDLLPQWNKEDVAYPEYLEDIVTILRSRTLNSDTAVFRVQALYFLAIMAGSMHATVVSKDRGSIPVNIYAFLFASSGFGKGHSSHLLENEFLGGFKKYFLESTFPVVADGNIFKIGTERAAQNNSDQQQEYEKALKEYASLGPYMFTFDGGHPSAVKQLRDKIMFAGLGAINLRMDEIGSSIGGATDLLTLFLELYDKGLANPKLLKNSETSKRVVDIGGFTPTNAFFFGAPSKLFDGGATEKLFYDLLETGFARRCLFGYGKVNDLTNTKSVEEIYADTINPTNTAAIKKWSLVFQGLADPSMLHWKAFVDDPEAIELLKYQMDCRNAANSLAEHEDIKKAEMFHRHFKALKIAGLFAFIEQSSKVTMTHIHQAIRIVEESGRAFSEIQNREKGYMRLARYLSSVDEPQTHADLYEALTYYKSSANARNEQLALAAAWGYKNGIIIKRTMVDDIELFQGEILEPTNLNEIRVSYSNHYADFYRNSTVKFQDLPKLYLMEGYHWSNHHFSGNHRAEANAIEGFNTVILDVDETMRLDTVHDILRDYKFITYTTKRHTEEANRFRVVIPINYNLKMDSETYEQFINNILDWLPFDTDTSTNQRSKKWETFHLTNCVINDTEETKLLDALDFIPNTSKNARRESKAKEMQNIQRFDAFFLSNMASGNRNNMLHRYARALVDMGYQYSEIEKKILQMNSRLSNPLAVDELQRTVLYTTAKKFG